MFAMICVSAQSKKKLDRWFDDARTSFRNRDVLRSISICERILSARPDYVKANLLLADIYNDIDSLDLEVHYLEKALESTSSARLYLALGKACYKIPDYGKALNYLDRYLQSGSVSGSRSEEISHIMENCRFAVKAMENPVDFYPERMSDAINTTNEEYWPGLSLDGTSLLFTRRGTAGGRLPQEDFFISLRDSSGWNEAVPIKEINTPANEGAQTMAANGRIIFFTACNRQDGMGSCDIYYSILSDGKWSVPQNAGERVNSRYWEAKPTISSDYRYLYFSSERPGGEGGKDLWRVRFRGFDRTGRPVFEEPENLGELVNTKGNEISPFIHPNNKDLYFASDHHTGMGGFDLFNAEMQLDDTFTRPENLGYPINTNKDEQGLHISADGRTGYFASARNARFKHDIYSFPIPERLRPEPVTYVKARVMDATTGKPVLAEVELTALSGAGSDRRLENTDSNGEILLSVPLGSDYAFNVSRKGYLFYSRSFQLKKINSREEPFIFNIELEPVRIGAETSLYNIYFETDSFAILPPSEPELLKLAGFLKDNPGIIAEVQGHTDSSGDSEFNLLLSEHRARSVVKFLMENGIKENRLAAKGYGARKPVASNETEEGREKNRRTTIKILGEK